MYGLSFSRIASTASLVCTSDLRKQLTSQLPDRIEIRGITEPRINANAIDQLVMKVESNKSLLKAMCKAYHIDNVEKPFVADFIRGKGEGRIILLHGPPGTGKTLTAGRCTRDSMNKVLKEHRICCRIHKTSITLHYSG
jgi:Cdc6-like AAA superfamily ATPase